LGSSGSGSGSGGWGVDSVTPNEERREMRRSFNLVKLTT